MNKALTLISQRIYPSIADFSMAVNGTNRVGGYLETFNPATGESLGQAAEANEADVDAAVEAAHRAPFATWRRLAPRERGAILKKIAQVFEDQCGRTRHA